MKIRHLILTSTLLVLAIHCGSGYNTDFAPPDPKAKLGDVYPERIHGLTREIQPIKFADKKFTAASAYGSVAHYGTNQIRALQFKNTSLLDLYFKENIVPETSHLSTRFSGKINGRWSARGSNPGKYFAWQNANWILVIQADSEQIFDEIVRNFPFIAPK
jgi:hypothetical protein